ncbi:hypothetical protein NGI46_07285 [Peribacillus butanolivorans]|uniref:hypothetical protein n=1 Tax=Peribacillus butanolivorans TaxID=421767 RepID=UPI00207C6959|nr:hypothetical protein [Peribacillus butanolivorans]MCO0597271.1 hypothetical protein [Peribacillus butanolivorans]
MKGEVYKKFKEEACCCYSLFYDENGIFRDEDLLDKNGFELKIMINNHEAIIKGQNRKELLKQYFETAFLPKIKNEEKTPEEDDKDDEVNNNSDGKDEGDTESFYLLDNIKSDANDKAETKI